MKKLLNSPWFAVSLAIVIMTVGYTVHLTKNGDIAEASYFCPAQEICDEGKCAADGMCSKDECKSCPRCKKGATS